MVNRAAGPDPSERPRVAVLTMTRDEGIMLRRWVDHYGREVGLDNLLVFDDNSSDGSTNDLPCTVHRLPPLPGEQGYERARMKLLNGVASGLLAVYDVVIFTDVDEFLIPDPKHHDGLRSFIASRPDRDVIAPVALNVVHHVRADGLLDPADPVLGQRRYATFVPMMCKPSIKRVEAAWANASHGIWAPFEVDPELFMIHLKFHDREALRRIGEHRRTTALTDGRAPRSSWSKGGEEMVETLDRIIGTRDVEEAVEFDPRAVDLASVVVCREAGYYRAGRAGQLGAMRAQPLVRVPERLLGRV